MQEARVSFSLDFPCSCYWGGGGPSIRVPSSGRCGKLASLSLFISRCFATRWAATVTTTTTTTWSPSSTTTGTTGTTGTRNEQLCLLCVSFSVIFSHFLFLCVCVCVPLRLCLFLFRQEGGGGRGGGWEGEVVSWIEQMVADGVLSTRRNRAGRATTRATTTTTTTSTDADDYYHEMK